MSNRLKFISVIAVIAIFGLLVTILSDIKSTYIELGTIKTELSQVKQQFKQYQTLVQKVNDIDTKFTQELVDAKAENDNRYNNVISGLGRLQLNIKQTATTSVADAKACELFGEARQNYYLLRDDIITKDKIILGLQEYIREVCLTNNQ